MDFQIAFKLDDEFRQRNRPQTKQERLTLERLIEDDQCKDGALTVALIGTEKILCDGYNTLAICQEKGISPSTPVYKTFKDRQEVLEWIDRNQKGRRNLSPEEMANNRSERLDRVAEMRADGKSIRVIAAEEKVDTKTIQKDIKASGVDPSTPDNKVIGKDGKTYDAAKPPVRCDRHNRLYQNDPFKTFPDCPQCQTMPAKRTKGGRRNAKSKSRTNSTASQTEAGTKACPACKGTGRVSTAEVSAFDQFWEAYPRKASKKAAIKAWNKLNPSPELSAAIIADVVNRSKSREWTKDDGQFIPHPSTYLNGERWTDEGIQKQIADGHLPPDFFAGLKAFVAEGPDDES